MGKVEEKEEEEDEEGKKAAVNLVFVESIPSGEGRGESEVCVCVCVECVDLGTRKGGKAGPFPPLLSGIRLRYFTLEPRPSFFGCPPLQKGLLQPDLFFGG